MRTGKPLGEKQVRANFKRWLKAAMTEGIMPPTEQGFDVQVEWSICLVAEAFPAVYPDMIAEAKRQLELQLNGTHAREQVAETRRWLDEHGLRW